MTASRPPLLPLTVGTFLIPLGIGLWFTGMRYGFDGGGSWTYMLAVFGIALVPIGMLFKVGVIVWTRKKGQKLPSWFWVDFCFWGIVALLFLRMFLPR